MFLAAEIIIHYKYKMQKKKGNIVYERTDYDIALGKGLKKDEELGSRVIFPLWKVENTFLYFRMNKNVWVLGVLSPIRHLQFFVDPFL